MTYKYVTDNNLIDKQNYMYSEYGGRDFLSEYVEIRNRYIQNLNIPVPDAAESGHVAYDELTYYKDALSDKRESNEQDTVISKDLWNSINSYVKTFEVRKRLYTEYDRQWKPVENACYDNYDLYLLFAEVLIAIYQNTECTKYFSCLLKLDDTMLSIQDKFTARQQLLLSNILKAELDFYDKLIQKSGIIIEER